MDNDIIKLKQEAITFVEIKHPSWQTHPLEFIQSIPDEAVHVIFPDEFLTLVEKKARMLKYVHFNPNTLLYLYLGLVNYYAGTPFHDN